MALVAGKNKSGWGSKLDGCHEGAMPMQVAYDRSRKGIDFWHIAFIAALGGPFLSGCTEKPDSRVLKPSPTFAASETLDKPPQQLAQPPVEPPLVRILPRPATRATAEKTDRKFAKLAPNTLVGLDPPAIGRLLGKPNETREDAMMIRWSYSTQDCALDVYFYPDIATGSFRALKYNLAAVKGRPGHGRSCTNYLMMARSDGSG